MEYSNAFKLFITHVEGEGPYLRISGQIDKPAVELVENLFTKCRNDLENGVGAVQPLAVIEGLVCAVKYKDGIYYRARVISTNDIERGIVGVLFIDHGFKDLISVHTVRLLENQEILSKLPSLAENFYLSNIVNPQRWKECDLVVLQNLLCYTEQPAFMTGCIDNLPFIQIMFKGKDLSKYLQQSLSLYMPVADAPVMPMKPAQEATPSTWPADNEIVYPEVVPFLYNQNFPMNPASTMRVNQGIMARPAGNSAIKAPRAVSLRPLSRQPFSTTPFSSPKSVTSSGSFSSNSISSLNLSPIKAKTVKSRLLEINERYQVYVCYSGEGPEQFAIQLASETNDLYSMMQRINSQPHQSLKEPPMIGTVCLGRMVVDRIVCRAIVMNISGSQCKLYYFDFGETEMTSYYDIFDIPEEFMVPPVYAMRFSLSGSKKLPKSQHVIETFKKIVYEKPITLKVVPPEGPPLIQYGELYLNNVNVLDILLADQSPRFTKIKLIRIGESSLGLVSYVESCAKFYIHLSSMIGNLNCVMEAMKKHCETTLPLEEVSVGTSCCALFPDDGKWYRALVLRIDGNKITVFYVDYGNEQEVELTDLRSITMDFTQLPALAMRCALKDFENKGDDQMLSNQLEMLVLEKTFTIHVRGMVSDDTMLVSLTDDKVSPALNIGQIMSQLSKPKSLEPKAQSYADSSNDRRRPPKAEEYKRPPPSLKPPTYRRKTRPEDANTENAQFERNDTASAMSSPPYNEQTSGSRQADTGANDEMTRRCRTSERKSQPRDSADNPRGQGWRLRVAQQRPTTSPANSNKSDEVFDRGDRKNQKRVQSNETDRDSRRDFNGRGNTSGRDYGTRDKTSPRDYNKGDNAGSRDRDFNNRDNASGRDRNYNNRDNTSSRDYNNRDNTSSRDYNNRNSTSSRDYNNRDNTSSREQNPRRDFRDRPPRNNNSSFESDSSSGARAKPPQVKSKQLSNPMPLSTAFEQPSIDPTTQHEVAVTWLVSPENFYSQLLAYQTKFIAMMNKINDVYRGVKPYNGPITEGDSILSRFPEDGVLYRATVVSVLPFNKYMVQYVDFGNNCQVESRDIWQLDNWLMELPKLAVHCALVGVKSKDGPWKATPELDRCFNAPRYQCVFLESDDGVFRVSMYNNGISVADTLIEKGLADASAGPDAAAAIELKDEPIDWALITNNNFVAKVTHIETLSRFFVHIDLEKMALIEELLAKATLTPVPADMLVEQMPCAVKLEDKVYRAINLYSEGSSAVELHLYDYGYHVHVQREEVMLSPPEVGCFYPQAVECCITNNNKPLKTLEQVKELLLANNCILHVDSVDNYRLMTTLYSLDDGKKIEMEVEPEAGVTGEVLPLCPRAVYNHNFGLASVAHCQSLTEIYLHNSTDIDGIALMLDELYKYYEEGTEAELLCEYEKGVLCAAKSSDGNWYRAIVSSFEDETAEVQFPDYGNCEVIAKDSVKKLVKQFHEPCARALSVSLGVEPLKDEALATLQEWIADKELQVTLSSQKEPGRWLANLHLDGEDLAMKLINAGLATPIPDSCGSEVPEGSTSVYVSHIDSPGQFWLQMPSLVDTIEEVQAELQANAATYPTLEKRELGTICAAQYSADEQWYRAEVLDADADITTVRFIDYGNADVLNNTPESLKALPEHLVAMPASAVKASVNAVPTGTGEWSEGATELFTKLLGERIDPFQAKIVLTGLTTYIDVFVDGNNVTDALVAEGHATKSDCSGDLPSCFASHVNSPAEFWIQLASSTEEFQIMEAELAKADSFPELAVKLDGVICAAKFNDDDCYYRAQIIVDGSEGTEVLFMDYGNASISTDLRIISSDLVCKPALARKCALQKPRDIKKWSRRAEEKFNEIAAEGATIFKVQFIASGDISVVELYLEGKSITETLVALCEEETVCSKPAPIEDEKMFTARLTVVESAKTFFVLLEEDEEKLSSVQEQLKSAPEYNTLSQLEVGTVCAALSDRNECWYRAKILQSNDTDTLVEFIDYGKKEICTELKQLPENLSKMEPLVKRCSLLELENEPDTQVELIAGATDFQVVFVERAKDPAVVKLFKSGIYACIYVESPNETLLCEEFDPLSPADVVNEFDEPILSKETTNICSKNDVTASITELVKDSCGEELNESNASFVTVVSISATADTGYTSSADLEKSPITDVATDEDSLSPRIVVDEVSDGDITCTDLSKAIETAEESVMAGDNAPDVSDGDIHENSKIKYEETKLFLSEGLETKTVEDDLELQSLETKNTVTSKEIRSKETIDIRQEETELVSNTTDKLSSMKEPEKLTPEEETEKLSALEEKEKLSSIEETEKLSAIKEKEKLSSIEETEEISSPMKEPEKISSIEETEELLAIKETEKLSFIEETEKLSAIKEKEKLSVIEETEEISSPMKEPEKISSIEETEELSAIKETEKVSSIKEENIGSNKEIPSENGATYAAIETNVISGDVTAANKANEDPDIN